MRASKLSKKSLLRKERIELLEPNENVRVNPSVLRGVRRQSSSFLECGGKVSMSGILADAFVDGFTSGLGGGFVMVRRPSGKPLRVPRYRNDGQKRDIKAIGADFRSAAKQFNESKR